MLKLSWLPGNEVHMADDKTKKDYRDKTRINRPGSAPAVRATGSSSVKKIENYLKDKDK